MRISRLLAHGLPLALDALACALVIGGRVPAGALAHAGAAAAAYAITRRWVSGSSGTSAAATTALLTLCLPAVGAAILAFVAWPSFLRQRARVRAALVEVPLPDGSELRATQRPLFSSAPPRSIRQVLAESSSAEERVRAVMALRHMDARRAVPLLRQAFAHESEDVRLLAFAILERREKRLRARIQAAESRLGQATTEPSERAARWHRRLGRDHWELVYGGFVSGDLEPVMLGKARDHLERAVALEPDPAALRLLGRIALRQRDPRGARAWLARAEEAGAPPATLAPWLAEAAWQERRFAEVATILRSVPRAALRRPELDAVATFWTQRGAETRRAPSSERASAQCSASERDTAARPRCDRSVER
jgi:polysaccharide biosynthesis protein PelE